MSDGVCLSLFSPLQLSNRSHVGISLAVQARKMELVLVVLIN